MLDRQAVVTGIHQGQGDAADFKDTDPDTIVRTSGSWITDGFVAGDVLHCEGSTSNDVAVTGQKLASVTALTMTLEAGASVAAEVFAAATTLIACAGGSLSDVMRNGVINVYSGSQPATADAAVVGTLLVKLTVSSGAFVAGAEGSGLEFDAAALGVISKCSEEVWSGLGLAAGTASWFRFVANPADPGTADSGYAYPRIDGTVGVSGADCTISNTQIVVDAPYTMDTFTLTFPMQYGA